MKKVRTILLLSASLAATSAPAVQAGPLRWVVETVGQKWATQQARKQAARESYREIGRIEAQRAARQAAQTSCPPGTDTAANHG